MNVKLTPIPVPQTQEEILSVDGVAIGTIKHVTDSASYKYHAVIKSSYNFNIYQGFGMTVDSALRDAIARNRELRNKELAELNNIENNIWGDNEAN